jgi:hypothetical protein
MAAIWAADVAIDPEAKDAFTDFVSLKYAATVDDILQYKFGDRMLVYSDESIEADAWKMPIKAYLFSKWRYIAQAMEYLASEYNPIENYEGHETEATTTFGGARGGQVYEALGGREDKFNYAEHTDTETPAITKVTSVSDKTTTTNKVSPFDGGGFKDREETTVSGAQTGGGLKTETTTTFGNGSQGSNQSTVKYGDHEDTHNIGAQTNITTTTQDNYKDEVRRQFDRHGNLGVMTAAQMLSGDSDFWRAFRWLDDLAQDISNILAVSVWAM